MKILVCLKQILDPDLPARDFQVDPEAKEAKRGGANLVTNIFCENALETALKFREAHGGEITALCFGGGEAEDTLRKALAMTADHAVAISNDGPGNPDPGTVSRVLAGAVKHLGGFDLVLVGRESGDWGVGQTGGLLAEELGVPSLSLVDQIEPEGEGLKVRRQSDVGFEVARTSTPCVLTITNNEGNVPRIPKTRDVMMSYRKPLTQLSLGDLGVDAGSGRDYYEVVDLFIPTKSVQCEFIEGDDLDERVTVLAKKISNIASAIG